MPWWWWWWWCYISQGQSGWQSFVLVTPGLVAPSLLCLGHIKIRLNLGSAAREKTDRYLRSAGPLGVTVKKKPQTCSLPQRKGGHRYTEPCLPPPTQCNMEGGGRQTELQTGMTPTDLLSATQNEGHRHSLVTRPHSTNGGCHPGVAPHTWPAFSESHCNVEGMEVR